MKRSHLLLLTTVATIALLLVLISAVPRHSDPAWAAPRLTHDSLDELLRLSFSPLYQAEEISCTLTTTTTDSLNNSNACPVGEDPSVCINRAVTLANYDDLALVAKTTVPEGQEKEVPVHTDWFRLDNAQVGAVYTVEALPNRTTNYSLGIVVYDRDLTKIITDADPVDNNRAKVTLKPESQGPYFFQVFQITPSCTGRTYDLDASVTGPTATPTPTEAPVAGEDGYEPNDSFAQAPTLPIQVPLILELTFHSAQDSDFFQFYTKSDRWYQASTSDLNRVDTVLEIYDRDQKRIERDDDSAGGLASRASWKADYDGYYFVVVRNNVDSSGSYNLTIDEVAAPTPGPSPTAPTPRTSADDCEPNPDFEHACIIPLGKYQTFNLVPAFGEGPDNDFYKVWIKAGLHYRCETSDLAPGVDPNMIMFRGPSWDAAIAGNDDVEPCDFNSALSFFADYTGWLYVLIGTGDRTPSDVSESSYTLRCDKSTTPFLATGTPRPTSDASGKLPSPVPTRSPTPGTPTPTGTRTPTPTPTEPGSPIATPASEAQAVSVRPMATPVPAETPRPRFVAIRLLVYYDANGDGQRGAGEGIAGMSARANEVATNELLAQDYTDSQGSLTFSVSAQGPVRLAVPYLGVSHLVVGEEADIQVRIPPRSGIGGAP
ncbi:MAG: hypothetical protein R6X31_14175 [Anaerolineae bacterium]